MAAKESAEMRKAKKMVLNGVTPYAAAKACGLTRAAIYNAPWYKEHRDGKAEKCQDTAK